MTRCYLLLYISAGLLSACVGDLDSLDDADITTSHMTGDMSAAPPSKDMNGAEDQGHTDEDMSDQGVPYISPDGCISDELFFARDVWAATLEPQCLTCHNVQGPAAQSSFVLERPGVRADAMSRNFEIVRAMAEQSGPAMRPLLLKKPTGEAAHGGGEVISTTSDSYRRLEEFVRRLDEPTDCEGQEVDVLEDVQLEPAYKTLRRFTLLFARRLPTDAELELVDTQGDAALAPLLDALMDEPVFGTIMSEGFNDVLLTDGARSEVGPLGGANHPDLLWFSRMYEPGSDEWKTALSGVTYGIDMSVKKLVERVINNDQPFTEILTADYAMVNPYYARTVSAFDQVSWQNPNDPEEFQPVQIKVISGGNERVIPHAGVLNNYGYLQRFRSSPTNLGRGRARMFMLQFLGTDILKFAPLNSDPLAIQAQWENPVRDAPDCATCHQKVDALAGLFRNHSSGGAGIARSKRDYPRDTFPAGYDLRSLSPQGTPVPERQWEGTLPEDQEDQALQWLAQQTIKDPRFSLTMVRHFYTLVMGREPMSPPELGASSEASWQAYEAQQVFLSELHTMFLMHNHNIKAIVKHIVLSSFWRGQSAGSTSPQLDARRQEVGTASLLTPEQLHYKIIAIFGDPFESFHDQTMLINYRRFLVMYGGIDSVTVLKRIREPNGLIGGVQHLIGNSVSCEQVTREFSKPAGQRLLFKGIELEHFTPQDEDKIRQALVHIHERVLGERLTQQDPEVDASYELFKKVLSKGQAAIAARETRAQLPHMCAIEGELEEDPDYVLRAWAAVLNYHIQSFEFLYD
jgi:hypothetical protein